VGYGVGYWLGVEKAKEADVTGQDGYATRTTVAEVDGQKACIMTLQKGAPPAVKVEGKQITVGDQTVTWDGQKLVLGRIAGK
jgi:hypothetical protein